MLAAASGVQADDPDEFRVGAPSWNGLSELVSLGQTLGLEMSAAGTLRLSELRKNDGLLLVHPTEALPTDSLRAFLRDGGRLALADDFGSGPQLLADFQIERAAPANPSEATRLRGNRNLPIAVPGIAHALNDGVVALATNHPRVLYHPDLQAIFELTDAGGAVVLTGAVGRGRLVAIGDSSLLIDNMLQLRGNRAFAGNLLRYLGHGGRVYVAAGATPLTGRYRGLQHSGRPGSLRAALERAARADLPPAAISASALVFALLLLFMAATALPRKSSYDRSRRLREPPILAGYAGRVAAPAVSFAGSRSRRRDFTSVARTLEFELRHRFAGFEREPAATSRTSMTARIEARGFERAVAAEAAQLLSTLAQVTGESRADGLDEAHFSALVADAERLLQQRSVRPATIS
ncbi:MAG: DUF4350 domain-containing protein [Myxococcales bacterium]|nr:DUF4350 domain-containing protein [Myxococcales bacterium]